MGQGAFGSVKLGIEKHTEQHVALKVVSMSYIQQINKERHIMRERDLLYSLRHPNIINLLQTFKVSVAS